MSAGLKPIDSDEVRTVVREICDEIAHSSLKGRATEDVEALSERDPDLFGLAIFTRDGELIHGGEADEAFSIQSISKVFSLALALEECGEELWERVGRDPSGDPFNSIIDLERHEGHARNPFINAGALVVLDMLLDRLGEERELQAVTDFISRLLDGAEVPINEEVAESSRSAGYLNRALMSLAKHFGNLHNPIERVLDAFACQCAIELSCAQLARVGRFLMLSGPDEASCPGEEAAKRARQILALMALNGVYDCAGEFAYRVGLPAKSGVGGGILAIVPNTASIAVWSPGLDECGNSLLGTLALEMLADRLDWSAFGMVKTR
jgi:glutaminase